MRVDSWQPPYIIHSPPSAWQGSDHTDSLTRPGGKTLTEVSKSQVLAPALLMKTEPPSPGLKRSGKKELGWGEGSQ